MGRFCILNFTQFSQNSLLMMKYCSVKDCKFTVTMGDFVDLLRSAIQGSF